jgi:hypothetical protein
MKKIQLFLGFTALSATSWAQNNLTITVDHNGSPAQGVAVVFYESASDFAPFYNNWRFSHEYAAVAHTNSQGGVSFSLANVAVGDSVFWYTESCQGSTFQSALYSTQGVNLSGSLSLPCLPDPCNVESSMSVDTAAGYLTMESFAYLSASAISGGGSIPDWNYQISGTSGPNANWGQVGFTGANFGQDFDTAMVPLHQLSYLGFNASFRQTLLRAYAQRSLNCNIPILYNDTLMTSDPGGSWSGFGTSAFPSTAFFTIDTNGVASTGVVRVLEQSTTQIGTITSYEWNFHGTQYTGRFPSHTYSQSGSYYGNISLNITADLGGRYSYSDWYGESVRVTNGMVSFKNMGDITFQVVDPAAVSLPEVSVADFDLYPNPAQDQATLSWDEAVKVLDLALYTSNGKLLRKLKPKLSTLDLSDLESGIYLIRLSTPSKPVSLTLIVQ